MSDEGAANALIWCIIVLILIGGAIGTWWKISNRLELLEAKVDFLVNIRKNPEVQWQTEEK